MEWVIRGPGLFVPPLTPVTIAAVERFNDYGCPAAEPGEWMPAVKRHTPFGVLVDQGFYRLQGTAGEDVPTPDDVLEAYTRLSDYLAAIKEEGRPGATSVTDSVPGVTLTVHRPVVALSRALEYSGAADLLKAYRHV